MHFQNTSVSERRTMPPAVAVSTVAFALRPPLGSALGVAPVVGAAVSVPTLWIPLVRRTRAPFLGRWALPGGPTHWDETLADTALRTLHDAVLRAPGHLEQLYSFGGVERSADAQRLVTIAYWALYGEHDLAAGPSYAPGGVAAGEQAGAPSGAEDTGEVDSTSPPRPTRPARWDDVPTALEPGLGDPSPKTSGPVPAADVDRDAPVDVDIDGDATVDDTADPNVAWFSADALPELAFDHEVIVAYALARLRLKTEYAAIAHRFLGPVFTLGQLRAVHEAVRGERVDPANFRRQELARGTLVDTGELESGTRHRPARLYRFRDEPSPLHSLPYRPEEGPR